MGVAVPDKKRGSIASFLQEMISLETMGFSKGTLIRLVAHREQSYCMHSISAQYVTKREQYKRKHVWLLSRSGKLFHYSLVLRASLYDCFCRAYQSPCNLVGSAIGICVRRTEATGSHLKYKRSCPAVPWMRVLSGKSIRLSSHRHRIR